MTTITVMVEITIVGCPSPQSFVMVRVTLSGAVRVGPLLPEECLDLGALHLRHHLRYFVFQGLEGGRKYEHLDLTVSTIYTIFRRRRRRRRPCMNRINVHAGLIKGHQSHPRPLGDNDDPTLFPLDSTPVGVLPPLLTSPVRAL
jgi:hypothetical protein